MSKKKAPIADPERSWRVWNIDELYHKDDRDHDGRYLPNKGDLIFSQDGGFFIVTNVDYSDATFNYEPWRTPKHSGLNQEDESKLISTSAGMPSQSYRLYLDTSVVPYVMAFDSRLKVYGSVVKHVKVFTGYNPEQGELISRVYDNKGNLKSDAIELEHVYDENGYRPAIKTPKVGNCSIKIDDGEVVTGVFYDDEGHVVSTSTLLVKNTSWIRRAHQDRKYVESIEIDSSFISQSDPKLIDVPVNVNMESVPMIGVVKYSNGEKKRMSIDGTKFKLMGLNQFVSTIVGQRQPLTLIYYLGEDEESVDTLDHESGHIAASYTITTSPVDGAYSVKIFTAPYWIDKETGYRLKHWLYSLERKEYYDVSDKVRISSGSSDFHPKEYGNIQDITFTLDLNEVDPRYVRYRHLQTTRIILDREGNMKVTPHWRVYYDKDGDYFGGMIAEVEYKGVERYRIRLDNGYESKEAWLRYAYERLLPILDPANESRPPEPTHFRLHVGSWSQEYSIDMWDAEFEVPRSRESGQLVNVQFIRREGDKDYQLAMSSFIAQRDK